ncbi:prepilin-type cleavage/methylation domain-containing protein [Virgibacillus indicus]|uniref:ComG operon protein 3 n=1 Tax=Virgibacillus indicus TaxID=2024554 RepID=A0A265NFB7_9BACI|nr:competence type IV pilus major pilin ComGC [Virgibacillus indicus]OZU89976.1 prepilin-type cleavage/methylation domain-containing protein [Virgibacillus indicus]
MFKNNKGFTLIEMLIVLMIISVLIILIVPNLSGKSKGVHDTGCDALVKVVQAQVDLFYLDKGKYPADIDELVSTEYISKEQKTCPNNQEITLNNGVVINPNPDNETE